MNIWNIYLNVGTLLEFINGWKSFMNILPVILILFNISILIWYRIKINEIYLKRRISMKKILLILSVVLISGIISSWLNLFLYTLLLLLQIKYHIYINMKD